MAKFTFRFPNLQFFSNMGTHFTGPCVQNIWELEGILETAQPLILTNKKIELWIHLVHIY